MRPLRIEMQGLRSYKGRVELDLREVNLLAVIGDTGAGKSSILEAIVFALYNGTTWAANETKPLICGDGDGTASVMLEFAADGKVWRVSRRISRSASPTAMHRLECLTPGETPFEALETVADIRGKIEEIVGLSYRAFITSVVLPQGQFENLLLAGDTQRSDILRGIFRLEDLATVRDRARSRREEERSQENELLEARSKYMPDPAGVLQNARVLVAELEPALEQLTGWCQAAQDAKAQLLNVRAKRRTLANNGRRLEKAHEDALNLSDAFSFLEDSARSFQAEEERLISTRDDTKEKLEHARGKLEAILKDIGDSDDLPGTLREARSLSDRVQDLRELRSRQARKEAELAQLETDLSSANCEHQVKQREARRLQGVKDDLRGRQSLLSAVTTDLDQRRHDLRCVSEEIDQIEARLASSHTAFDGSREMVEILETRYKEIHNLFLEHVRAEAGLKVSAHASAGEPCPVCERELPKGFSGRSPEDVKAEEDYLREARDTLEHTAKELNDARGDMRAVRERITFHKAELEKVLVEEKEVRKALALCANKLLELEAIAEGEASVPSQIDTQDLLHTGTKKLQTAENAYNYAATAETTIENTCRNLAADLKHARERRSEDFGRLERGRADFLKALQLLPTFAVVQRDDLPTDPLDISDEIIVGLASKIESKLGEVRAARGIERALVDDMSDAKDALQQYRESKERELLAPAREAAITLSDVNHRLDTAAAEMRDDGADEQGNQPNHGVPAPGPDASIQELYRYSNQLAEAARHLLNHRDQLRSEFESSEEEQEARLHGALEASGATTYQELLDERDNISFQLRTARAEMQRAYRELPTVERIEASLDHSRRKREAYDTLYALLAPGKFVSFASRNRQQQLLGVASDIFGEMTDNEYGFTEDFAVIHRPSRQQRPAKTLSGGETFLASLALALGLMEIAGRSGGRLESFFLDEGFGTLDRKTLDRALAELERRALEGRMVALLSHVPEVADYVRGHGHVLRIRRGKNGSSVAHFDEEEPEVDVDAKNL